MRTTSVGIMVGLLLGLGAGCKNDVSYYCDETTPCADRYPDRPFCDLYGTYEASGHVGRTCIPNPLDASVDTDAAVDIDSGTPPADGGVDAAMGTPDASGPPDAGGPPDAMPGPCDPVTQTGCVTGQKCTYIQGTSNHTGCATDGTTPIGGSCTSAGVDDCVGGSYCQGGECVAICSTSPDTCGSSAQCQLYANTFDDRTNVGLCVSVCNPLDVTSCGSGEMCALVISSGIATCQPVGGTSTSGASNCAANPGTQGCDCMYLNACNPGYGCLLVNDPSNPTGNVCAFFCDPTQGGAGPSCSSATGGGSNFSCRQLMTFYTDATNVDPAVGLCIDPNGVWSGVCAGCIDSTQPGCGSCP